MGLSKGKNAIKIKPMLPRKWFFTLTYFRKPRWDTGISPPELLDFIATHPPGRGIDLGCGTGTNAITLAQHGWQMIGIDFVGRAIAKARKKAKKANLDITFIKRDITQLEDFQEQFDLVLDIGCYHSLPTPQRQKYQDNLNRLIKPGGTYLLYGFLTDPSLSSGHGLGEEDIHSFCRYLQLIARKNGLDGNRPSAWFTFTRSLNV